MPSRAVELHSPSKDRDSLPVSLHAVLDLEFAVPTPSRNFAGAPSSWDSARTA